MHAKWTLEPVAVWHNIKWQKNEICRAVRWPFRSL